ncbi:hypothetical protein SUGI_0530660 [Cryptomeria japonica]|nr:hypothetical protein SUGI_0530660 [Cryptomeria japonica]
MTAAAVYKAFSIYMTPRVTIGGNIQKDKSLLAFQPFSPLVIVVDERGCIVDENIMAMMLRWGIKAYPFPASREEELRKAEWEEFNFSAQSGLEFVFQNLERCQSRLEKVVQVFFVGEGVENPGYKTAGFEEVEKDYEIQRKEMCSITSLSLSDVYKFWERVKCLWDELGRQGVDKKTVQVRSMVLAFVSACKWRVKPCIQRGIGAGVDEKENGISIIAVDENGEMINGRGEEIVQLLCHKFMGEIRGEGFSNAIRRSWRDGTIHPKSHPHPLFRLNHNLCFRGGSVPEVRCDACFCVIDNDSLSHYIRYRCVVCEKYEMCQKCFEC